MNYLAAPLRRDLRYAPSSYEVSKIKKCTAASCGELMRLRRIKPCPPFLLSAVFVADWLACPPMIKEKSVHLNILDSDVIRK